MISKPTDKLTNYDKFTDKDLQFLYQDRCKNDLKYLCCEVLRFRDWDTCHDNLSEFLRKSAKNKKLILMPREHLKSSIVTIAKAIQHILADHNISILFANAVQSNSESFLSEVKEYLTTKSLLQTLFGKFESSRWNQNEIIVKQRTRADKTPTISVAGADTALTSQHYDIIFLDDIVNRQTVNTSEQIAKTKKFYSDCLDLLKKPNGILYVIGTRWDDNDLYGTILKEYADDFDTFVMQATTDGVVSDNVIFPKKFNKRILQELLRQKGSWEFYLQYMNTVTSSENMIFKPPIRYYMQIPEGSAYAITVDPAISKRDDSCDAVIAVTAINQNQQLCVADYALLKENEKHPSVIINKIFEYVQRYQVRVVGIESNGYQEVLCLLVEDEMKKRNIHFEVVPIRQSEDKAMRIIGLQAYWERGDLLLKQGMSEAIEQFEKFRKPITSKVDLIDAIAMRLQLQNETGISPKVVDKKSKNNVGWVNGNFIPKTFFEVEAENERRVIAR